MSIVSSISVDETILLPDETIFPFGAGVRKQRLVINLTTKNGGGNAGNKTGDSQMRTLSFVLAFAFVLVGPSLAGPSDNGLPGVGTFAYSGSPVAVPHALRVAAR